MMQANRHRCAAAVFVTLAVVSLSPRGQADQVVVLRNGNLLQGQIERVRDRLVVTQSLEHIVHVPLAEVDFVAEDSDAAYRRQLERIGAADSQAHVRLAHWCLREGLVQQAADRLLYLSQHDPGHPGVRVLETRLRQLAADSNETPAAAAGQKPSPAGTQRDPVKSAAAIERFPATSLATFTRIVQPLLRNSCGRTTCHGSATTSDFQVQRGPHGIESQSVTWRNLKSTLLQVDVQDPEASPLLAMARTIHGASERPPMEPYEQKQYELLAAWVHSLGATAELSSPATETASVPKSTSVAAAKTTAETPVSEPVSDPFDPAQFNAQHAVAADP